MDREYEYNIKNIIAVCSIGIIVKLLFGNNFDNDSININLFKSANSVDYKFLMSNVISKLLSSS